MAHYVFQASVFKSLHHYHSSTHLWLEDNPLHPSYPIVAKKQDHFGPQQQGPDNAAKSQVSLEFPRLFRDIFWASHTMGRPKNWVITVIIIQSDVFSDDHPGNDIKIHLVLSHLGDLHLGKWPWFYKAQNVETCPRKKIGASCSGRFLTRTNNNTGTAWQCGCVVTRLFCGELPGRA